MKNILIIIGFIIAAVALYVIWENLNSKLVVIESNTGSFIESEDALKVEIGPQAEYDLEPLLEQLALLEAAQSANARAIDAILKRLDELKVRDCDDGNCFNQILGRETIYFDHDDSTISPRETGKIDKMIESMSDNSFVSLRGHADTTGDSQYNHLLSLKRAAAVKRYIDSKFSEENRINNLLISIDSTGEELVVNATADDIEDPLNRIVEILIFE